MAPSRRRAPLLTQSAGDVHSRRVSCTVRTQRPRRGGRRWTVSGCGGGRTTGMARWSRCVVGRQPIQRQPVLLGRPGPREILHDHYEPFPARFQGVRSAADVTFRPCAAGVRAASRSSTSVMPTTLPRQSTPSTSLQAGVQACRAGATPARLRHGVCGRPDVPDLVSGRSDCAFLLWGRSRPPPGRVPVGAAVRYARWTASPCAGSCARSRAAAGGPSAPSCFALHHVRQQGLSPT